MARWIEHPEIVGPCHTITWTASDSDGAPEPIQRVTVNVVMPNNASAEGALWTLHTPVASRVAQPALAEGVVGADNTFLLPEMAVGTYRLELSVFGYEPLDTLITIESDTTELSVTVNALQPQPTEEPATPTPEPTGTLTPQTPAVTMQPTSVSGVTTLPETGTGSDFNTQATIISLALMLVMSGIVGFRLRGNRLP